MKLHLVCDVSGSMAEGGKPFAMRTVALAVGQWVQLGYASADISLCGWSCEVRPYPHWRADSEYPTELLSCQGRSNWNALTAYLGEKLDDKVLLLTDGFWPQDAARLFKRWQDNLPLDTLRTIKIGADAHPRLKGPGVFSAQDFFVALDAWWENGPA